MSNSATLNYTIPNDGTITPSISVTANLTLSASANASGYYTVTGASGTYTSNGVNYSITGVSLGTDGADNLFNPNGSFSGSPSSFVTLGGITFVTTDPSADGATNASPPAPSDANFFFNSAGGNYSQDQAGSIVSASSVSVSNVNVCFAAGTRIRTPQGDIPVEKLKAGDIVLTASGAARPVKWLGHRAIDCRRHPNPKATWPVRIAAHAFGESRPARDLLVSPGHSVCVDVLGEVLIPASHLINGATIAQVEVDEVTYWHVELESHDILLAENLPTESYLDVGNRAFFKDNGVIDLDAAPDAPFDPRADTCRPFHDSGPIVEAVHHQLRARAPALGWRLMEDPLADLHLIADGERIEPDIEDLSARFVVPASARELWLMSHSSVPRNIGRNEDGRTLGVCLAGLSIDDGLGPRRVIALDDPRLGVGFYGVEEEADRRIRWMNGRALLPKSLWAGCHGAFFLRLDLAAPALPRWVRPTAAVPQDHLRLRHARA